MAPVKTLLDDPCPLGLHEILSASRVQGRARPRKHKNPTNHGFSNPELVLGLGF